MGLMNFNPPDLHQDLEDALGRGVIDGCDQDGRIVWMQAPTDQQRQVAQQVVSAYSTPAAASRRQERAASQPDLAKAVQAIKTLLDRVQALETQNADQETRIKRLEQAVRAAGG